MIEMLSKFKEKLSNPLALYSGGLSMPFGKLLNVFYGATPLQWYAALFLMTIFDWVAGTAAARKDGIHTSEYGREGLSRTFVALSLPALGKLLDMILGTNNYIFFFFIGATAFNTWLSFTANVARAGWDKIIPTKVLNVVADEIKAKTLRAIQRKESLMLLDSNKENQDTSAS